MAEPTPTAVTYVGLPLGSGSAHGLGRTGLRDAHARTQAFVDACMIEIEPRRQFFNLVKVPELPDLPAWAPQLWERFSRGDGRTVPVADSDVGDALSFLDDVDPQPRNQWGVSPLRLCTNWTVALLDPSTGEPFPGQNPGRYPRSDYEGLSLGESRVQLVLHNSASVSVSLCFPDLDDTRLKEVLASFQQNAPFKFSRKHWKRWTPTKTGSFRSVTITPI